jgi:hypothetical protein
MEIGPRVIASRCEHASPWRQAGKRTRRYPDAPIHPPAGLPLGKLDRHCPGAVSEDVQPYVCVCRGLWRQIDAG